MKKIALDEIDKRKVLFLVPYPSDQAPSQRFRFEQYLEILLKKNSYSVDSFISSEDWKTLYQTSTFFKKLWIILKGLSKRAFILFQLHKFSFIFIHREILPIGPPVFEFMIAKIFRKRIIYDFDDAIWLTDKSFEPIVESWIKCRWKVGLICKWSYKISCGNLYLANYARKFNKQVIINPTTINTISVPKFTSTQHLSSEKLIIGWTGSHSTLKYLKLLEPVLLEIEKKYPHITFKVIADKPPELLLTKLEFCVWRKESEIDDLSEISIGIMPLPDDEWTKGKCGFKALQYMALGIPTIAAAVGVNTSIINNGVNGYVCTSHQEWLIALEDLINSPQKRKEFGAAGRETVELNYSVKSNEANFLSLFS